jgi:hypothetical protein
MGKAAARSMAAYQDDAWQGRFIDEIRAIWDGQMAVANGRGKKTAAFQRAWLAAMREPTLRRMLRSAQRSLDRHLLWRFH